MLDPTLVRSINFGRCFAFIGAGPSAELGYPSWRLLSEIVRDNVLGAVATADQPSYDAFLREKDYPALLRQAEVDLGSRQNLVSTIKQALKPSGSPPPRPVYEYLAKWPFACYLTTNFDDELQKALEAQGQHYQVRHNSQTDLSLLRDGVSHLIVKIHSDLEHPNAAIITSADYDRVLTGETGAHIRQKLRQVFEMFDVFIIGHSMTDPDLRLILQTAKHTASPLHPIHMLLANATSGQIREFRERYNIRLLTYEDGDGHHRKLRQAITVTDHFVRLRDSGAPSTATVSDEEVDAASSLLLFQRLKAIGEATGESAILDSLLLFSIATSHSQISQSELVQKAAIAGFAASLEGLKAIDHGLSRLITSGLVELTGDHLTPSSQGKTKVNEVTAQRSLEQDQALGQFELDLQSRLPDLTSADRLMAKRVLRNALVDAFRSRGIAIANVIIADQSLSAEHLSDLFRELSKHAATLASDALQAAFLEAAHHFLIAPTGPQRAYLASLSQGFFLYHMAGMDPTCARTRQGLFANTCWFVDSSVILPLFATGSHNHEYAVDLFEKLNRAEATLFTTADLTQEAKDHLDWAVNFIRRHPVDSPTFLSAALVHEGFKQNLFIDGYVRESAAGTVGTFTDYLARVAPSGSPHEALSDVCTRYGVRVVRASEMEGFLQEDWGDIEEAKAQLATHRKYRGTFRGDLQVQAEAEVLVLIRNIRQGRYALSAKTSASPRVYFISQSRALDFVATQDHVVTWTPEAVYRYVSSLPGAPINADLLQECMLHEYFYAGVSFVDRSRYLQFFGPSIRQAKLSYREQIDGYLRQTEQIHRRTEYDAAFDSTPDLEKAFFVAQMGWELARRAEERAAEVASRAERKTGDAEIRARVAENRASDAEARAEVERKARITAEQQAARLRNLGDPKHLRKREKQAKKRYRKKK